MIKLSLFLTRRNDISREKFVDYWVKIHLPLARAAMGESSYIRRYAHQYALEGLPSELPLLSYDGVMEAWFDDMDGLRGAMSVVNENAAVAEDEEKFIDRSKTVMMISSEALGLWPSDTNVLQI